MKLTDCWQLGFADRLAEGLGTAYDFVQATGLSEPYGLHDREYRAWKRGWWAGHWQDDEELRWWTVRCRDLTVFTLCGYVAGLADNSDTPPAFYGPTLYPFAGDDEAATAWFHGWAQGMEHRARQLVATDPRPDHVLSAHKLEAERIRQSIKMRCY